MKFVKNNKNNVRFACLPLLTMVAIWVKKCLSILRMGASTLTTRWPVLIHATTYFASSALLSGPNKPIIALYAKLSLQKYGKLLLVKKIFHLKGCQFVPKFKYGSLVLQTSWQILQMFAMYVGLTMMRIHYLYVISVTIKYAIITAINSRRPQTKMINGFVRNALKSIQIYTKMKKRESPCS